jgi:hypothetical protein
LGIQARKSGDYCTPMTGLSTECNNIFVECCKQTPAPPQSKILALVLEINYLDLKFFIFDSCDKIGQLLSLFK